MKRRAKGEGSIVQRPDRTWQFSVDLGKDERGKRQRRYVYASSKSALQRKIVDLRAKGGGEVRPRAKGSVGEWVEAWLRDDVEPNRSAATFAIYSRAWRHAAPVLAAVPLERLDADHVTNLYRRLREGGVGKRALQQVGAMLRRAVAVAIRRGAFHRSNPFADVGLPKYEAPERRALSVDEAQRFLAACRGDRYEALWVLLLTAGLRLGEGLGLEWRDVDLDAGRLTVRQALTQVDGRITIGPLKTRHSRRVVELGDAAVEALRKRRAIAEEEGQTQFVFLTPNGAHPRRENLTRDSFRPISERAGIGGLTPHGLRHAMTALLLAAGTSPRTVSERLGHSSTRMTLDRYAHVIPGMQRAAAESLDVLLSTKTRARAKRASSNRL